MPEKSKAVLQTAAVSLETGGLIQADRLRLTGVALGGDFEADSPAKNAGRRKFLNPCCWWINCGPGFAACLVFAPAAKRVLQRRIQQNLDPPTYTPLRIMYIMLNKRNTPLHRAIPPICFVMSFIYTPFHFSSLPLFQLTSVVFSYSLVRRFNGWPDNVDASSDSCCEIFKIILLTKDSDNARFIELGFNTFVGFAKNHRYTTAL